MSAARYAVRVARRGLATAAAVVVPLLGGLPLAAAIAIAVVNLVIGLAIGSLVVGAAGAAYRPAR